MNAQQLFDKLNRLQHNGFNLENLKLKTAVLLGDDNRLEYSDGVYNTTIHDYSKKIPITNIHQDRQELIFLL